MIKYSATVVGHVGEKYGYLFDVTSGWRVTEKTPASSFPLPGPEVPSVRDIMSRLHPGMRDAKLARRLHEMCKQVNETRGRTGQRAEASATIRL